MSEVIPAQAVEAAAGNYWDLHYKVGSDPAWVDAVVIESRNDETGQVRDMMLTALEAAAPHMLAASFDEAADDWAEAASWSDSRPSPEQVQRWLRSRANTYRTPDAR